MDQGKLEVSAIFQAQVKDIEDQLKAKNDHLKVVRVVIADSQNQKGLNYWLLLGGAHPVVVADPAMAGAFPGGIDLNSRNLIMKNRGEKIDIRFNQAMIAQFEKEDFSGLKFKVLDVVPINLSLILGL